jgi:N-acetylmuramoyl-L-alanine amidase
MHKIFLILFLLNQAFVFAQEKQKTTSKTTPSQSKTKTVKEQTAKKIEKPVKKDTIPPIILVIDPGHGGSDPGKPRSNSKYKNEKELTLLISLKFGELVEKKLKNVKVIYTRKEDKRVSLDAIVDSANLNKADYFLSIHCNANPIKSVQGAQFHIQNHRFLTSRALAESLEKEFLKLKRKSFGVIDRHDRGYNYQVLQYTEMAGVLVEMGFMTNPWEEVYLNSKKGQEALAQALFQGFKHFIQLKKRPLPDYRTPYYKVQIASSATPENTEASKYKKLGMRVDEIIDEKGKYKYRYMVGREYERQHAQELAEKVREMGFKDAFIVKMPLEQKIK